MTDVEESTPEESKLTAHAILEKLDAEAAEKKAKEDGDWARSELALLRGSALDTKTIYSFCFVANRNDLISTIYGATMVAIAFFIQTIIPIAIIATTQPLDNVDKDLYGSRLCPRRSNALTKIIGIVLSLYFVILTISLCTNKLRGMGFLHEFIDLGPTHSMIIKLGIASQFIGMGAAGGAQFLLFIGNGGNSYVVLLLQSLAMQFCLTVDQRLVSDLIGKKTSIRLNAVTKEEIICNGAGCGEPGQPMPPVTLSKVTKLVNSEKYVLAGVSIFGVLWTLTLGICL